MLTGREIQQKLKEQTSTRPCKKCECEERYHIENACYRIENTPFGPWWCDCKGFVAPLPTIDEKLRAALYAFLVSWEFTNGRVVNPEQIAAPAANNMFLHELKTIIKK